MTLLNTSTIAAGEWYQQNGGNRWVVVVESVFANQVKFHVQTAPHIGLRQSSQARFFLDDYSRVQQPSTLVFKAEQFIADELVPQVGLTIDVVDLLVQATGKLQSPLPDHPEVDVPFIPDFIDETFDIFVNPIDTVKDMADDLAVAIEHDREYFGNLWELARTNIEIEIGDFEVNLNPLDAISAIFPEVALVEPVIAIIQEILSPGTATISESEFSLPGGTTMPGGLYIPTISTALKAHSVIYSKVVSNQGLGIFGSNVATQASDPDGDWESLREQLEHLQDGASAYALARNIQGSGYVRKIPERVGAVDVTPDMAHINLNTGWINYSFGPETAQRVKVVSSRRRAAPARRRYRRKS